jgi:ribosomal-protein-alanine N-acetyltransferase
MFWRGRNVTIETDRLTLRLPRMADFPGWVRLRRDSEGFLAPWEPLRAPDHLTRRAFRNRVWWSARSVEQDRAVPLFLVRRDDGVVLGAITIDNIRRGPAQTASIGYWIGAAHARQGYMREAVEAAIHYCFDQLGLSRVEAACLPENAASRGLLEKSGFKYEGVAQSYLQIAGRWRTHVLYAVLRGDRRGRSTAE